MTPNGITPDADFLPFLEQRQSNSSFTSIDRDHDRRYSSGAWNTPARTSSTASSHQPQPGLTSPAATAQSSHTVMTSPGFASPQSHRGLLPLSQSPREFVPSAQTQRPTYTNMNPNAVQWNSNIAFTGNSSSLQDPPIAYVTLMPTLRSGSCVLTITLDSSPAAQAPPNYAETMPKLSPTSSRHSNIETITGRNRELLRETRLREIRSIPTPPPRSGSPDDRIDSLAGLADRIGKMTTAEPLHDPAPLPIHPQLQAVFNDPTAVARDRQRNHNQDLYTMQTPRSLNDALKMGLSEYDYQVKKTQDYVRKQVPGSQFPFYDDGREIDESLQQAPINVKEALMCTFNLPLSHAI